jgi:hypothetical protein
MYRKPGPANAREVAANALLRCRFFVLDVPMEAGPPSVHMPRFGVYLALDCAHHRSKFDWSYAMIGAAGVAIKQVEQQLASLGLVLLEDRDYGATVSSPAKQTSRK